MTVQALPHYHLPVYRNEVVVGGGDHWGDVDGVGRLVLKMLFGDNIGTLANAPVHQRSSRQWTWK
jgi:hypothetical protein